MNAEALINDLYPASDPSGNILRIHSRLVADKALRAANAVDGVDLVFLEEAALLHDIGIRFVHAPKIHCYGDAPYICHGTLGREHLEHEGYPEHALVCERHTGVGITLADIHAQQLPLPQRDMTPQSIEEILVCYADCFYSKNPKHLDKEKPVDKILKNLAAYGEEKSATFQAWHERFG